MRLPTKKIIAFLIKCFSCREVNAIPAPDKATHRNLELIKLHWVYEGRVCVFVWVCVVVGGPEKKIRVKGERREKEEEEEEEEDGKGWWEMDRQLP